MDLRLVVYGVWAAGSMLVWGLVLRDDIRQYRWLVKHQMVERRRISTAGSLWSDFALLLVAIASALSIASLAFFADVPGVRGFALAGALGSFLGAGIVKYSFRRRR